MAKQVSISKQTALKKLNDLVHEVGILEVQPEFTEAFTKWTHDTRVALKHFFPNETEHIKDFQDISYSPGVMYSGQPPSDFQNAYRSGLGSARAFLQSRIDEITEFWDEDRQAETSGESTGHQAELKEAAKPKHPNLVFVIHGRQLLGDFHDFLRALGLKPLEWSQARALTKKPNPYTWEIVDTALTEAGANRCSFNT